MSTVPPPLLALLDDGGLRTAARVAGERACHLVGGALRDAYLGLESPDLDLVVAGGGHRFASILAQHLGARLVVLGGDRFSAYRLVARSRVIDIWDRQSNTLEADLRRRDFTINAMALGLSQPSFHDPFGGVADLEGRRLAVVSDASMREDPVRSLRLVRLALLLPAFSIASKTIQLARSVAERLTESAAERVRDELTRLLRLGPPTRALDLLGQIGVLPSLWCRKPGCIFDAEKLMQRAKAYERFEEESGAIAGRVPDRLVCIQALIAQSLTAAGAPGGARAPSGPVSRLDALVGRKRAREIARLGDAAVAERAVSPRRFLATWGQSWLEAAAVTESVASAPPDSSPSERLESLTSLVAADGAEVLDPRPLLDGHEIGEILDIAPGPVLGRVLELLLDAQIDGTIRTREEALQHLPGLLRRTGG